MAFEGYEKAFVIALSLRESRRSLAREKEFTEKLMLGVSKVYGLAKRQGNTEIIQELHDTLIDAFGREQAQRLEEISEAYATLMEEQDGDS